jgi:PAS domain S-box-containing protein
MTPTIRLLVVDDEEFNRDMLGRRLQRHGYAVVLAESAAQGLEAIASQAIDLVLLDIEMPEMSGLDMLREIRRKRSAAQLPVIMVTAKSQSEDMVEALDLGANDYVTKPIDLHVVLARIRTQVARQQAEQALIESEERYALAVRGSNDGLWDWKIDSDTMFFSPRWNELLGLADVATTGPISHWLERVHPEDNATVRDELDEHLRGLTAAFECEHRVRHEQGHYLWALARGMAVRDPGKAPVRMAGSLTDITQGKVVDALTGLPNRVLFRDRLVRMLEQERRDASFRFALLLLDLDSFKNVNDSLGHQAGDQLLVRVAERLELGVRTSDMVSRLATTTSTPDPRASVSTVARLGGDEFAVLLSGLADATDAVRIAERLGEVLQAPFHVRDQELFVSASIGIALSGMGQQTPDELIRDADTALYRAKDNGRARFEIFDQTMHARAVQRLALESELRRAIERDELVVVYQPIVSLTNQRVATLEALVRWQHPRRGLVPPGEFLGVAEESLLIVPMGLTVLRHVCRDIKAWREALPPGAVPSVAVNLSARQLAQPDLADRLVEVLDAYGVAPHQIELEITESTMMVDAEHTQSLLQRLRAAGFQLTIDDFGTGYSSLAYLQSFPVHRLKIDRSFVSGNVVGPEPNMGIVRTIVALARQIGLAVVAEGIENIEQNKCVTDLGCDFGQGHYFDRPLQPDAVARLLQSAASPARIAGVWQPYEPSTAVSVTTLDQSPLELK